MLRHAARRFCPPARPHRLFALRGGDPDQGIGAAVPGGADAGGGDHRYRQFVRGIGVRHRLRGGGRAADHRLRAGAGRPRGGRARQRVAGAPGGAGPDRVAGAERGRVSQSAGAGQPLLSRRRGGGGAVGRTRRPRGGGRRADLPHGWAQGAGRAVARRRAGGRGGGGAAAADRGFSGPALYRADAARRQRGGARRARPNRPRLSPRVAAPRHQRRLFPGPRFP